MEVLANQVFSEKQIVTSALLSKDLRCNLDEANKMLYKFYMKHRENLEAYFIIVKKEGTMKLVIDRLPEQRLNYLLEDQEYSNNIISLKIWAIYDKSQGELDINDIYEVEDADLHAIQNLCYNMRELDLKKAEYQAKRSTTTPSKVSSQTSNKKSQNNVQEKAKPIVSSQPKESQEHAKKQPEPKETKAKVEKEAKMIEEPPKAENLLAKNNQKKRKVDVFETFAAQPAESKELKKTKITERSNSIEEERKPVPARNNFFDGEEEFYYADDTPVVKTDNSKLKCSETLESPVQNKPLKKQNSINIKEEKVEKPAPVAKSEVNKPKPIPSEDLENETPEEITKIKKIRKVEREKTYMDEKGYLIVEKELVDEEYWEDVKAKPNHMSAQSNNSQAAGSKKKAPEKNQATLASFFRKK